MADRGNTQESICLSKDIPKKAKTSTEKPLTYFAERYKNYSKSMANAYLSGHYTLAQVGRIFWCGLCYSETGGKGKGNVKCNG